MDYPAPFRHLIRAVQLAWARDGLRGPYSGAVLVGPDGSMLGEGRRHRMPSGEVVSAELAALDAALAAGRSPQDATLYSVLAPRHRPLRQSPERLYPAQGGEGLPPEGWVPERTGLVANPAPLIACSGVTTVIYAIDPSAPRDEPRLSGLRSLHRSGVDAVSLAQMFPRSPARDALLDAARRAAYSAHPDSSRYPALPEDALISLPGQHPPCTSLSHAPLRAP